MVWLILKNKQVVGICTNAEKAKMFYRTGIEHYKILVVGLGVGKGWCVPVILGPEHGFTYGAK